jgi:hypothetical protein
VFAAIRAAKSEGSAIASSKLLVWRDWVPPEDRRQRLVGGADHVVHRVLLWSETPEVWQWVRSMRLSGLLRAEALHDAVPQEAGGAELGGLHEEFMPMAKKNDRRGAKLSTSRPAGERGADVFAARRRG